MRNKKIQVIIILNVLINVLAQIFIKKVFNANLNALTSISPVKSFKRMRLVQKHYDKI